METKFPKYYKEAQKKKVVRGGGISFLNPTGVSRKNPYKATDEMMFCIVKLRKSTTSI